MKRKMYTLGHDMALIKKTCEDARFTAQEHAYVTEKEYGESVFETRETLLRHELPGSLPKLGSLGFLIDLIEHRGYKNVLSLGAGRCVLEFLLSMSLPEESQVVACDFDPYIVNKGREFFPEMIVERFDFFRDDIQSLQSRLDVEFDLAVFFGSAYVMDDMEFIKFFGDLKKIGVKQIIDFHAGYMDSMSVLRHVVFSCFKPLIGPTLLTILRRPLSSCRGKFHGYARSRGELRRLYRGSGLELQKETSASVYEYVALLDADKSRLDSRRERGAGS